MRLTVSRIHLSVGRLQPPDALIEHADDDLVAVLLQLGSEAECAPDAALDRWRRARPLAIFSRGRRSARSGSVITSAGIGSRPGSGT